MTNDARRGIALTREVPDSIAQCELTHLARQPIDLARARAEHASYERALEAEGFTVRRLQPAPALPDSVFVEDTAIVLDRVAVITRPGAASRRPEVDAVREALQSLRPLQEIVEPATLDGGDVLMLDTEAVVGRSTRTSDDGVRQLAKILSPLGLRTREIEVTGCLHLKSAVTRVGLRTLLANPAWVDVRAFPGWTVIECDEREPAAANALWLGDAVIHHEGYPRTRRRLEQAGVRVIPVPASELARAEGGVTCCSLLVTGAASLAR